MPTDDDKLEQQRLALVVQERSQRMTLKQRTQELAEAIKTLESNSEHMPLEELEAAVEKIEQATILIQALTKLAQSSAKKAPPALANPVPKTPEKESSYLPVKDNAAQDETTKERHKKNAEIMRKSGGKKAPKKKRPQP